MNNYSKELLVHRLIQINRERVLFFQNTNKERGYFMCSRPNIYALPQITWGLHYKNV